MSRGAPALAVAVFEPPADGLLAPGHIDLYLKVRRAAKGRPDSDAARAVGALPEEFAWARGRITEALVALDARRVRQASAGVYARSLASLRETARALRDPVQLRELEEQIAALERERSTLSAPEKLPPGIAENARRVAARLAEIQAVTP